MGTVEYMRAVRQRYSPRGVADETDETMDENDETKNHGAAEASSPSQSHMESVTGIFDFLKMEHIGCLQRGELWDANAIQNTILDFLYKMLEKLTDQLPLQGVSATLQLSLENFTSVQLTKIDGKQQIGTNGSSDSMSNTDIFPHIIVWGSCF